MHIIASLNHLVKLLPTDATAYSATPYSVKVLRSSPSDAVALPADTSIATSRAQFANSLQRVRGDGVKPRTYTACDSACDSASDSAIPNA